MWSDGEMITSGMFSFGFCLQHNTIYLQRALAVLLQLKQYKFEVCMENNAHTYRLTRMHAASRASFKEGGIGPPLAESRPPPLAESCFPLPSDL